MSRASDVEQQMLELINEERTSRGLDPVALELNLNESSEDHSTWMLNQDQFSHTGANGSSAGDRMTAADFDFQGSWTWGENIAYQSERGAPGLSDDVEDLHTSLMNSPGHRANILNPDFEVIGIGIEVGEFEGTEGVMVTQNFAATDGDLQLDTGTAATPETPAAAPDIVATAPTSPPATAPASDPETQEEPPAASPEPDAETPVNTVNAEATMAQLQALMAQFGGSLEGDTLVFNTPAEAGSDAFDLDAFLAEVSIMPENKADSLAAENKSTAVAQQGADDFEQGLMFTDAWDSLA